jgi:hypothetical protein
MNSNIKPVITTTALLMTIVLIGVSNVPRSTTPLEGTGTHVSRDARSAARSADAAPEPPGYTWD